MELIEHDDQFSPEEKKMSADIKKSCHLNLAATCLKVNDSKEARKACNKVSHVHIEQAVSSTDLLQLFVLSSADTMHSIAHAVTVAACYGIDIISFRTALFQMIHNCCAKCLADIAVSMNS